MPDVLFLESDFRPLVATTKMVRDVLQSMAMLFNLPACPKDAEVYEHYIMRQLPTEAIDSFEEHVLICGECQNVVDEFDLFVQALRALAPERFQVAPHSHRDKRLAIA